MEIPEHLQVEFRDCVTDVLAMTSAFRLIQSGDFNQILEGLENYRVLLPNADPAGCLQVAITLLSNSWMVIATARARAKGVSPEAELAELMEGIRRQVRG